MPRRGTQESDRRMHASAHENGHTGGPSTARGEQGSAAPEGQWNLFGGLTFDAGASHFVEIDTANGRVSADAVKLVVQ